MKNSDIKIDLVYLWVDGSDAVWAERKARMLAEYTNTKLNNNSIANCRFQDNNELLYSLRSVEKNLQWINHIYIVADNQKPNWLNVNHEKITLINQKDIMEDYSLPCFNSCAIETYLSKIPNLSEYFIYANDDMFFFNKTPKELFFDENNNPIYQMGKKIINKPYTHLYGSTIVRANKLIKENFDVQVGYFPHHGVDPYRKSYLDECISEFKEEIETTRRNHFRSFSDLQRVVFAYYAIAKKGCRYDFAPSDSYAECKKNQLEKLSKSKFPLACINSGRKTTDKDVKVMKDILQNKFPFVSAFENNKQTIDVCLVGDENKINAMQDTVLSVLKNKNINESINIWIIDNGIKKDDIIKLKTLENSYDCKFNFIETNLHGDKNNIKYGEEYAKACCDILFSNDIESDRIVYIDNGIEVGHSLAELYESDFEENYILSYLSTSSQEMFLSDGTIKCGVMLINLSRLRQTNSKWNHNISDIITSDKVKFIKKDITSKANNKATSPFGAFLPLNIQGFMKSIFFFKKEKEQNSKTTV